MPAACSLRTHRMFSLRKGTIIMTNNPRYTLGTEANRIFMASETYELL